MINNFLFPLSIGFLTWMYFNLQLPTETSFLNWGIIIGQFLVIVKLVWPNLVEMWNKKLGIQGAIAQKEADAGNEITAAVVSKMLGLLESQVKHSQEMDKSTQAIIKENNVSIQMVLSALSDSQNDNKQLVIVIQNLEKSSNNALSSLARRFTRYEDHLGIDTKRTGDRPLKDAMAKISTL